MGLLGRSAARAARLAAALLVLVPLVARAQTPGDLDGDGFADEHDNCVFAPNATQADQDGDGIGDACDRCPGTVADVPDPRAPVRIVIDVSGCDLSQRCPCAGPFQTRRTWRRRSGYLHCVRRVSHQLRRARRMTAAERDTFLQAARGDGCGRLVGQAGDLDGDGIPEDGDLSGVAGDAPCPRHVTVGCDDNCPKRWNPHQGDANGDGQGNVCDRDADGDGVRNRRDNCWLIPNPDQKDDDEDEVGDACDDCPETDTDDAVDARGCS